MGMDQSLYWYLWLSENVHLVVVHHKRFAANIQHLGGYSTSAVLLYQFAACLYTPLCDIGGAVQDGLHEEELLDIVPGSRGKIDHVTVCCLLVLGSGVL